ncbi:hypothetical protein N7493_008074 [Penicillium malachiteum]|uniref:RING-type domain-containing protein n=1 Tax=Penicillium malachiteum TaxID=1324776 RepID=A0AAD6HGU8_9EURO|nr:hypothetical protein N7493_008074 [Penicillium malachiteum]
MWSISQNFLFPTLILDYYEERLEEGQSMLEARDNTIVWLSLLGSRLFQRSIDILRDAGKILEFENIYYGGPGHVGITTVDPGLPYRDRYFEVTSPLDEGPFKDSDIWLPNDILFRPGQTPQQPYWSKMLAGTRVSADEMVSEGELGLCRFCFTALLQSSECLALPCEHWFCSSCVSSWLRTHDSCPDCCEEVMDASN